MNNNFLSFVGLGRTAPDPSGDHVQPDGLIVPKGKGANSDVENTSLLYNEYPFISICLWKNVNDAIIDHLDSLTRFYWICWATFYLFKVLLSLNSFPS